MPSQTVRHRVLAQLRKHPSATAAEIGRALNISAADARHHLSILVSDGRVAQVGLARRAGRGRPVKQYGLSGDLLGDNFPRLTDSILSVFLSRLSPDQRRERIEAVADQLAQNCSSVDHGASMMGRLASVVEGLNKMHYHSRWEAGPEGPRILFGHCPYADIIANHPELCRMDARLLSGCLGGSAMQISRIGLEGATQCIFLIGEIMKKGEGTSPMAQTGNPAEVNQN